MSEAPKRRWFSFSLRSMFVAMTLFGCWLAYELNWIHQRHDFIADETSVREHHPTHATWSATIVGRGKTPPAPWAPGMLWAFGEDGYSAVCVLAEAEDVENLTDRDWVRIQQARKLFPKANVQTVHVWDRPDEHGVKGDIPPANKP